MVNDITVQDRQNPPTPSKQELYYYAAKFAPEAIQTLYDIMKNDTNGSNRVSAAKTLLAKVLPDLKVTDLSEEGAKTLEGLVKLFTSGNPAK